MVSVDVRMGESIDQALRRFNREVLKAGVIAEIRKREFYISPSMNRKLKKQEKARKAMGVKRDRVFK